MVPRPMGVRSSAQPDGVSGPNPYRVGLSPRREGETAVSFSWNRRWQSARRRLCATSVGLLETRAMNRTERVLEALAFAAIVLLLMAAGMAQG